MCARPRPYIVIVRQADRQRPGISLPMRYDDVDETATLGAKRQRTGVRRAPGRRCESRPRHDRTAVGDFPRDLVRVCVLEYPIASSVTPAADIRRDSFACS
jgi:hypothetical protein